ncbi:MAG: hypothetical protein ACR2KQ_11420 [Actinomycetota bacterium]
MKRYTMLAIAVGAALAVAAPSLAQIPPGGKVVIEDPEADANFVNDQGTGDGTFGDHQPGASPGTVSDLTAIVLKNDAKNLYVEIQTLASPPATTGIGYRVRVAPKGHDEQCLLFESFHPGANNNLEKAHAHVVDNCEGGGTTEVEILGNILIVPRDTVDALGKGGVLATPQAQAFLWSGTYPQGVAGPVADTTLVGEDYKLVDKKKKKKK